MGVPQVIDELDFRLEQRPGHARAVVAPVHPVFAAVVHAEMHFQCRFGREHLLAQHTPVDVLRVRFHQVFLHVFGRGERRGTLLARILGGGHQEVADDVLLVILEMDERQMTMRTGQLDLAVVVVRAATGEGRPARGWMLLVVVFAVVQAVASAFLFDGWSRIGCVLRL